MSRPLPLPSFFFNDTATTEIYTLSLHDALPIYPGAKVMTLRSMSRPKARSQVSASPVTRLSPCNSGWRSEEHTSELQSRPHLVCRLLLEKKKKKKKSRRIHQRKHTTS